MKTPFTSELAEKYGFDKKDNYYTLETNCEFLVFLPESKEFFIDVDEYHQIYISCYLENIKALYFALTNDVLEPIE